jgi:4-hydroxy-3-polyprenylbenzoate decarboxylase
VHAVDAAGVHPLMLAIGSERYTPYQRGKAPAELLTQSNAILGQGQMSLAKYLLIVNRADDPQLDIADIGAFLCHVLQRADWRRDLHFQTRTTIDTLDYSGSGLNHGSKLVIAAAGDPIRELGTNVNTDSQFSAGFTNPRVCLPGGLAVQGPAYAPGDIGIDSSAELFCSDCREVAELQPFPLVVIVDDSDFVAESLSNFLWVVFTRSNPAADVYGIDSFVDDKHWGCRGSLVIDARIKPHHAPLLEEDPATTKKVDARAACGGPLARYL